MEAKRVILFFKSIFICVFDAFVKFEIKNLINETKKNFHEQQIEIGILFNDIVDRLNYLVFIN